MGCLFLSWSREGIVETDELLISLCDVLREEKSISRLLLSSNMVVASESLFLRLVMVVFMLYVRF